MPSDTARSVGFIRIDRHRAGTYFEVITDEGIKYSFTLRRRSWLLVQGGDRFVRPTEVQLNGQKLIIRKGESMTFRVPGQEHLVTTALVDTIHIT